MVITSFFHFAGIICHCIILHCTLVVLNLRTYILVLEIRIINWSAVFDLKNLCHLKTLLDAYILLSRYFLSLSIIGTCA